MAAEIVAPSRIRRKLREVQRVCEGGSNVVPTTIADIIELAREVIEITLKNATFSSLQTDSEAKLVGVWAAGSTMRSLVTAAKGQVETLKRQLSDALVALDKPTDESPKTQADIEAKNDCYQHVV